jgi:hypothetical protein
MKSIRNQRNHQKSPEIMEISLFTLARIVKDLPNEEGIGIFWWAAEYQVNKRFPFLVGFECRSFFNRTGYRLPILREFGRLVDESITLLWFCWRHNVLHYGSLHIHEEIGMALSKANVLEYDEAKDTVLEEKHMTCYLKRR